MINFRIDTSVVNGSCMLFPIGDVDAYTSKILRDTILSHLNKGCGNLVVNFEHTGYIDSSGLAALIRGLKYSRDKEGRLIIVARREEISRVFDITGLNRVFSVFDSVDLAMMPS
ncbi:MAG: STAS domain-containing protein [Patescibacteria group bacterium]|nr:STAS domain-containing protein [Patescibacteria group bacterium]